MDNDVLTTTIDLVRHGEHVLGDSICGVTDPELSKKGWAQMQQQCHQISVGRQPWDVCISSPRIRCAHFSRHFSEQRQIEFALEQQLAEVDFGQWEAMTFSEISQNYPGQWQMWIDNPDSPAPHGGEQYGLFLRRIESVLHELVEQHQGKKLLIFAHGGVIRAVFHKILGLNTTALNRFHVPYAGHSRFNVYHSDGQPDWYQIESLNAFVPG